LPFKCNLQRYNAAPASYPAPPALADLRGFKVMPADHVNYAATWGGLCVATGVLAAAALRGKVGGRGGGRRGGGWLGGGGGGGR
jgi:hypothetical protein